MATKTYLKEPFYVFDLHNINLAPILINFSKSRGQGRKKRPHKNPAYGRHWISRSMRIVAPRQVCKRNEWYFFATIFLLSNKVFWPKIVFGWSGCVIFKEQKSTVFPPKFSSIFLLMHLDIRCIKHIPVSKTNFCHANFFGALSNLDGHITTNMYWTHH